MDAEEAVTIGRRLRRIRVARNKTLEVIADRAGISFGYLGQLERGERALDGLSLIKDLAIALEIAPSELTRLPVPAPTNGETDAAVQAVRLALMAVNRHQPGGQVLPVEALRARVTAMVNAHCRCDRHGEVGAALPALIRDLYSSIAAGRDVAELIELAVMLHTQATIGWLRVAGAPLDLREQAATLAQQAAQHRDTPTALGLAVWGGLYVMLNAGTFDLAAAELDAVTVPTTTPESMQLAGTLALSRSLVAAVDSRPGDVAAPFEQAVELAERTGEGNAYGLGFGPTNVALWRMFGQVDVGDYEQAVNIAEGLHPQAHLVPVYQADYWVNYGRGLARLRGRRDDAVRALRRAELISPHRLYRDPFAREVIGELVERSRQDAIGRELRRLAWQAGLDV
ncbi:MAG: helix-turn-helix domain-containing protein [Pseudonocardiaceae bacterium]